MDGALRATPRLAQASQNHGFTPRGALHSTHCFQRSSRRASAGATRGHKPGRCFVNHPMTAVAHSADRALLARTRAGDAEAFGEFYRARRGAVLAFLRPRVASAELAADLMCETFVAALAAVHAGERELPDVPVAWLVTIARNQLIDSVRRGRVEDAARRRLAMAPLELRDARIF